MPTADPYSTHLAPLVGAVLHSGELFPRSDIVEYGCGYYSTPLLAGLSRYQKRRYRCVTSSLEWSKRFCSLPDSMEVILSSEWRDYPPPECGILFIDNEELVVHRFNHLFKVDKTAGIVVLHDARPTLPWGSLGDRYKYIYTCTRYPPYTTILSNSDDPSSWEFFR